jgi:hypothetical protein
MEFFDQLRAYQILKDSVLWSLVSFTSLSETCQLMVILVIMPSGQHSKQSHNKGGASGALAPGVVHVGAQNE